MAKQSYQNLIGAELSHNGEFWTVNGFEDGKAVLGLRGKETRIDLNDFMKEAGLNPDQFDPSTAGMPEQDAFHGVKTEVSQLDGVPAFRVYKTDTVYQRNSSLDFPNYPKIEINKSFDRSLINRFVVFDTEATGLSPDYDRLVQLSAIRYENGKPALSYNTYINPGIQMTDGAKQVTHLNDAMLKDAPAFHEIADSFKEFVGTDPLVGYYIRFDLRMLWTHGLDLVHGHTIYDAQWYTFDLIPKGYLKDRRLSTVADYLGIHYPAHNSLGDSYATGELFLKTVQEKMQL